jgi:hypothetical protein
MKGVLFVDAHPGQSDLDISANVFSQICPAEKQNKETAIEVVKRCTELNGGVPPLVVFKVKEVQKGESYSGVITAARTLVEDLEMRVLIDSSENSLPPGRDTIRENHIYVNPMTEAERDDDTRIKAVLATLKEDPELKQDPEAVTVVKALCGGIPGTWAHIGRVLDDAAKERKSKSAALESALLSLFTIPRNDIVALEADKEFGPTIKPLLAKFSDPKEPVEYVTAPDTLPANNKVLRHVGDVCFPRNRLVQLLLKLGRKEGKEGKYRIPESLEDLKKAIREHPLSDPPR